MSITCVVVNNLIANFLSQIYQPELIYYTKNINKVTLINLIFLKWLYSKAQTCFKTSIPKFVPTDA